MTSVEDPNRLCSYPDPYLNPGSNVCSGPAPEPKRIRINSDPNPNKFGSETKLNLTTPNSFYFLVSNVIC